MLNNYNAIYEKAYLAMERTYQDRETYPKDTILPHENEIISPLKDLEHALYNSEDLKYARRIATLLADTLDTNYWADIPEEGWQTLYSAMEKLKNPKTIIKDEEKQFSKTLISYNLSRWPQRTFKTEKRKAPRDQLGSAICDLICKMTTID